MPLSAGDRFGAYEIVGPLGAGGMGEVYRATDPKLGRQVAIKILPHGVEPDPEQLARFDREARLLASLNHPHIGTIFGREESGGAVGLVLELVEGPTLAERIGRPMRWTEARTVALQIIDAVSCAHEGGIVHRDLKPANIKITPSGAVKVLDFGLAKIVRRDPTDPGVSRDETISIEHTVRGTVIGTAAYMSPEQARGHDVDRRTDVWAFGCILYEMLTGRRAFRGDSVVDTISAVLDREPDWSALPADVPLATRELLRRCLMKDPNQRLRDIADARFELDSDAGGGDHKVASRSQMVAPWALAALLAIALAIAITILIRQGDTNPSRERVTFVIPPPPGVQWGGAPVDPFPVPAPNGRLIAYSGIGADGTRLWVHDIRSGTVTAVPGVANQTIVAWAPDSASLVYCEDGKLVRVHLAGAAPNAINAPGCGFGISWGRGGQILYASATGFWRVDVEGGSPTEVPLNDPAKGVHIYPRWLPDGRRFVYLARDTDPDRRGIYLGTVDGAPAVRLVPDESAPIFVEGTDGRDRLLFVRGASLVSQRLNLAERRVEGDPIVVADRVPLGQTVRSGAYGASPTLLVHRSGGLAGHMELVVLDRAGRRLNTLEADGFLAHVALAPDDSTLAANRTNVSTNRFELWQFDLRRGGARPLRVMPYSVATPVWSPDGKRIAFLSDESGFWRAYQMTIGAEPTPLQGAASFLTDWSSDGRLIVGSGNSGLIALPADASSERALGGGVEAALSPDMKWLAYRSAESGSAEVYLRRFPDGMDVLRVSRNGGYKPLWRPDGRELYFRTATGTVMAVAVNTSGTIDPGEPLPLFTAPFVPGNTTLGVRDYAVTRDGQRFIAVLAKETPIVPLTVVLNWLQ